MDFQLSGIDTGASAGAQTRPPAVASPAAGSVPVQGNSEVESTQSDGGTVDRIEISQKAREISDAARGAIDQTNGVKVEKPSPKNDGKDLRPAGLSAGENNEFFDYFINKNSDLAIKVIDRQTHQEIRQIPPEGQQAFKANYNRLVNLIYGTDHPPELSS